MDFSKIRHVNKFFHDSGSSSGEDSGIQEDSDIEFPDWTELSSTLDIRYSQGDDKYNAGQQTSRDFSTKPQLPCCPELGPNAFAMKYQESPTSTTLQTTKRNISNEIIPNMRVSKTKPVTLASRSPTKTNGRGPGERFVSAKRCKNNAMIEKASFGLNSNYLSYDTGVTINDNFSEFISSFECIENFGDMDFCYEDPLCSILI